MKTGELIKKKRKPKQRSVDAGLLKKNTFPTLARIALRNGLVVEVPLLPTNISELTSYDNLRIAMEHAALATSWLDQLGRKRTPRLADAYNLAPIRLNLEDLMNHLYFAIEGYRKKKG